MKESVNFKTAQSPINSNSKTERHVLSNTKKKIQVHYYSKRGFLLWEGTMAFLRLCTHDVWNGEPTGKMVANTIL
jgi:hypothetical protein